MKVRTYIRAGECPADWYPGTVEKASGGGYYGTIRGESGQSHYFNMSYTSFYPNGQGVWEGQRVWYAPNPEPGPRYGKVFCVQPVYS